MKDQQVQIWQGAAIGAAVLAVGAFVALGYTVNFYQQVKQERDQMVADYNQLMGERNAMQAKFLDERKEYNGLAERFNALFDYNARLASQCPACPAVRQMTPTRR